MLRKLCQMKLNAFQDSNASNKASCVTSIMLQCSHMIVLSASVYFGTTHESACAVQWSHDESALPGNVKAALENRQEGNQSQASLPDAAASQQQVRSTLCNLAMGTALMLICPRQNLQPHSCNAEHPAAQKARVLG